MPAMLKVRCAFCRGAGSVFDARPCSSCQGRGYVRLFPTPLEAAIEKSRQAAVKEVCDQAGL